MIICIDLKYMPYHDTWIQYCIALLNVAFVFLELSCSLLGVDKLFSYAINEWLNDIKKNQLPGLLGGVGPIHSLVQLGKYLLQLHAYAPIPLLL